MNKTLHASRVLTAILAIHSSVLLADDTTPEELLAVPNRRIITYRRIPSNEPLPQLGARLYDKVDYELKLRKLDAEIKLTKARLAAQGERTRFYEKHFGRTPALLLTRQNSHLAELESELRLTVLRKEKQLLLRHRQDIVRYRQLIIADGDARVNVNEQVD